MSILFVSGFMADETLWDEMLTHLETSEPVVRASLTEGDSIRSMALAILEKAPPDFVLVGFSMGGYVAREMLRLAPDRVRALALIGTSARGDNPEQARSKAAAVEQLAASGFSGLAPGLVKTSLHPSRGQDRDLIERVRGMSVRLGKEAFVRQAGIPREGDLDKLSGIHCPTLIIAAEGDRLRSVEESREMTARIPGAELIVIPDSGHMIPLEVPEELARILGAWLARLH